MNNSLVIIPTYNEKENIAKIIEHIFLLKKEFDILIIDDNSPDGTAKLVKDLMEKYKNRLHIKERSGKLGLGTAYIEGFKWALEKGYQYIFEMDADFSHNPDDLLRLYDMCSTENTDLCIGSRYIKGGKITNWPINRILLSYFASLYVRFLSWMPVKDPTAGFVCYKSKVLKAINLDKIKFMGYAFQIQMKFAAWKMGFSIKEIPITFTDRQEGTSKMSTGIFKEAMFGVLKMQCTNYINKH